jgi:hypothetical protein
MTQVSKMNCPTSASFVLKTFNLKLPVVSAPERMQGFCLYLTSARVNSENS